MTGLLRRQEDTMKAGTALNGLPAKSRMQCAAHRGFQEIQHVVLNIVHTLPAVGDSGG